VLASLQKFKDLNVIWVDAHPDIHTYDSTASGNTHGTPLSICTGMEQEHWASRMNLRQLSFQKLTYCGIRDID
jgi:arginase